jgi:hypothetical protein
MAVTVGMSASLSRSHGHTSRPPLPNRSVSGFSIATKTDIKHINIANVLISTKRRRSTGN